MSAAGVLLLKTVGETEASARSSWVAFLDSRLELTSRMELATCDGCDSCGLRCMDGFTVTEAEADAVNAWLSLRPPDEVSRVLGQEKTVPWPGAEELGATVTYCRYRDMENGNCFVYPARPTVCRLFGHTNWLPCPIGAITEFPEGGARVWNSYQRFEKETWANWEAKAAVRQAPPVK